MSLQINYELSSGVRQNWINRAFWQNVVHNVSNWELVGFEKYKFRLDSSDT